MKKKPNTKSITYYENREDIQKIINDYDNLCRFVESFLKDVYNYLIEFDYLEQIISIKNEETKLSEYYAILCIHKNKKTVRTKFNIHLGELIKFKSDTECILNRYYDVCGNLYRILQRLNIRCGVNEFVYKIYYIKNTKKQGRLAVLTYNIETNTITNCLSIVDKWLEYSNEQLNRVYLILTTLPFEDQYLAFRHKTHDDIGN